jgi:acyl-coenzyme A thioesterase PaaI-like protein
VIKHHDGCFGCGLVDLARTPEGVAGTFVVSAELQGPPGFAHGGIMATVLDEAMALLLQDREIYALTTGLDVRLRAAAPVGTVVELSARIEREEGRRLYLSARAGGGETEFATAGGVFVRVER